MNTGSRVYYGSSGELGTVWQINPDFTLNQFYVKWDDGTDGWYAPWALREAPTPVTMSALYKEGYDQAIKDVLRQVLRIQAGKLK